MRGIRAIVFDVYNTLVQNNQALWLETFREIRRVQRLEVDHLDLWQAWRSRESRFRLERIDPKDPWASPPFRSYASVWRNCFAAAFQELGQHHGDADAATAMSIAALGRREPFPETLETLEKLNGSLTLAVLSNADVSFLQPLLASYELKFAAVLSSEEAQSYKPHPLPFQMVLDMLNVAPHEAVMVGDSVDEDILGGHKAGMKTVWVNRQGKALTEGIPAPDYQVSDLRQLVSLMEGLRDG